MITSDFSQHISRQFNTDLEHVLQRALAMGSLIEQQLNSAVSALLEGDTQLAKRVVLSNRLVNQIEVRLWMIVCVDSKRTSGLRSSLTEPFASS